MTKTIQPFGTWTSPLLADQVAGEALRFGLVRADEDGNIYWSEGRPSEAGRCVLMRQCADGGIEELLPAPYSARSRIHEYGGGEFMLAGATLYFINNEDQDIYSLHPGKAPQRITNEPDIRFADMAFDKTHNRLIAVAEQESEEGGHPENLLVAIHLDGTVEPLVRGHDFFASPTLTPQGNQLAWLAWNLPHMPWDSAALYVASLNGDGSPETPNLVAGGDNSAVFQPEWQSDGTLTFVWDKTGWSNLYRFDGTNIEPIAKMDAEFSRPLWALGMRSYAQTNSQIVAAYFKEGRIKLASFNGDQKDIPTDLRAIDSVVAARGDIAALATSDTMPPAVIAIEAGNVTVIRPSSKSVLSQDDISSGIPMQFNNRDGEPVYGLYYPPANAKFAAPENKKPPVLFTVHGGPSGMADRGLKLKTQYWTSRGFGLFDTDYSGSTSFGRAYRGRLDGLWGVKDVNDIADAASYMVAQGHADPKRLLITGGSAGGMTVLLALATSDQFAAGASYYGVTDLNHLLKFTHKFEAGYLYRLLGVEPGEESDVFTARSPVAKATKIKSPVIFFQGLEDNVVPPEQSRMMVDLLKQNGVPVEYVEFEGEAHGFRQARTIKTALEKEYEFYAKLLGL